MNSRCAAREQLRALQRRVRHPEIGNRRRILRVALELIAQRLRNRRTATRRESSDLLIIRDRHDARNDRNGNPRIARAAHEIEIRVVIEKELRDQECRAAANLEREKGEIARRIRCINVHLGIARRTDTKPELVVKHLDEIFRRRKAALDNSRSLLRRIAAQG